MSSNILQEGIDYYEVLEIDASATASQIRSSYLRLCSITHPDRGGCSEAFARLQKAYSVLSNPEQRLTYDEKVPRYNIAKVESSNDSQYGVVRGVHGRVHGQTGPSAAVREAEQAAQLEVMQAQGGVSEEDWIRQDAEEAVVLQSQGNAAFRQGDLVSAVEHYTGAVRLVAAQWGHHTSLPQIDAATLYSNRAAAFTKMGNYYRALADIEEAIERRPEWSKAHLRLGMAHFHLKQFPEALEAFTQCVALAKAEGEEGIASAALEQANQTRECISQAGGDLHALFTAKPGTPTIV